MKSMPDHVSVRVTADADDNTIERESDTLIVTTTAPVESGQANQAVKNLVREYLSVDSQIRIVSGHKSRQKILAIDT